MKEKWYLIGDIHGERAPIACFYEGKKKELKLDETISNVILLGDVAFNFCITGKGDWQFKRRMSQFPIRYICLRGNHEARVTDVAAKYPERWERVEKYGGTVYIEKEFPMIEYLEDVPAVYNFGGYKTLSIPGAYSVDKGIRLANGWTWFANEQLSEEERELGRELIAREKSFDLVISHTCPISFEPRDLFLSSIDQSKVDKTMEEYLGELEYNLDYKRWAWGHFHEMRLYPWDGDKEKLMMSCKEVVDLDKFMNMKKTDCLQDIYA